MKVAVQVEVTDEIKVTKNGKQQQVVYVHLGDKYPVKDSIWVDGQPKPAGTYIASRLYRRGYDIVLDLAQLAVPAQAKSA